MEQQAKAASVSAGSGGAGAGAASGAEPPGSTATGQPLCAPVGTTQTSGQPEEVVASFDDQVKGNAADLEKGKGPMLAGGGVKKPEEEEQDKVDK